MNDHDQASFDPRVAEWLEGDPNTAPDQALQVVLAAFPSIDQRRAKRLPRRTFDMITIPRVAFGAAAVVAIVVIGGVYFLKPFAGTTAPGAGATPGVIESPVPSASASPTAVAPPVPAVVFGMRPGMGGASWIQTLGPAEENGGKVALDVAGDLARSDMVSGWVADRVRRGAGRRGGALDRCRRRIGSDPHRHLHGAMRRHRIPALVARRYSDRLLRVRPTRMATHIRQPLGW